MTAAALDDSGRESWPISMVDILSDDLAQSEADEPHAGQVGRSIICFSKKGSRWQIPAVRLRRGVYHPRGAYPSRNPGTRYLCASDKQLEANRQNALQSTGRKTAEGLEPVNNNATRDRLRWVPSRGSWSAPGSLASPAWRVRRRHRGDGQRRLWDVRRYLNIFAGSF